MSFPNRNRNIRMKKDLTFLSSVINYLKKGKKTAKYTLVKIVYFQKNLVRKSCATFKKKNCIYCNFSKKTCIYI